MKEGTILLVEDNEDDVLLTMRAFKKQGILNQVVHAKDGAVAVEFLLGKNGFDPIKPIIVLLDLQMPKLNGLEVLKIMKENESTANTPVVVLTTSSEEEDVVKSYNLGANSFIRKPVDFDQFAKNVGQLGLYWLVLNEPPPQ